MRDPSVLKRREVKQQHRKAAKAHMSKNRQWVLLAETLDEFR
jgi:hypothetical protein